MLCVVLYQQHVHSVNQLEYDEIFWCIYHAVAKIF